MCAFCCLSLEKKKGVRILHIKVDQFQVIFRSILLQKWYTLLELKIEINPLYIYIYTHTVHITQFGQLPPTEEA